MSVKGILKKVKVKVRSEKVTIKQKLQTCGATHVFWVILHADIDGDSHLTRRHLISLLQAEGHQIAFYWPVVGINGGC